MKMGISTDIFDQVWAELEKSPDPMGRLVGSFFRDIFKLNAEGKFNTIGLDPATMVIGGYGLGLWPVVSITTTNQEVFRDWLFGYITKAGINLTPWQGKDGVYDLNCDHQNIFACVIAFDGHRMNTSVMPKIFAEEMIGYLNGTKRPTKSIRDSKVLLAMAQNAGAGSHNQTWISLLRITQTLLGQGQGLNKKLLIPLLDMSKRLPPECIKEYLSIVGAMPDIYMGQDKYQPGKPLENRGLWRFTGKAKEVAGTLTASDLYTPPTDQSLISFMFTVNVPAWLTAAQNLMQSMVQTPYQCPQLSQGPFEPQKLQQALMMTQFVPPFARGIKGISASLLDFKMSPQGIPDVDAMVILTADQAPMLMNLIKSNPQFKDFEIPQTDAPASTIRGIPLPPPAQGIKIKVTQNGIGLAMGTKAIQLLEERMKSVTPGAAPMLQINYQVSAILKLVRELSQQAKAPVDPMFYEMMKSSIQQIDIRLLFNGKGFNVTSKLEMD